jgi:hypothetical protein
MFIGIKIIKKNKIYYSRSMELHIDLNNHTFIAQCIRDIDYSLLINLDDKIILDIIVYPNKDSYYSANNLQLNKDGLQILGRYKLSMLDNGRNEDFSDLSIRKYLKNVLDNRYNLTIEFSLIKYENDYILSTPFVEGNENYLSNQDLINTDLDNPI